jgi:alanine racemase
LKSWIEISPVRLRANFEAIQQAAGPAFEVVCVIKANAYGHGAPLCAPILVDAGARWLGVADLEEGIRVRQALAISGLSARDTHVLVMCGFEPSDAYGLLEHELTPVVWTPEHIQALEAAAAQAGRRIAVHAELDTGMARQGAVPGPDLDTFLHAVRAAPHIRLEGVFSHLSCSEIAGSMQTTQQIARLGPALELIFDHELMPEVLHLANSSAVDEGSTLEWVLDTAVTQMSATPLVRTGLGLYGYTLPLDAPGTGAAPQSRLPSLLPLAHWKTRIIGLRDLQPGDTVGYGATYTAPEAMRVALLPVGYADGFRREASSGAGDGWVMIAEQRAPVVGRVSMNLTVVDVTAHGPGPAVGDEVVLLGEGVTAHDHALWCGTIPYEILCGMRGHHRLVP